MIWLVGATGLLGNAVANQLKENNIDFIGTSSDLDITDISNCRSFVSDKNISHIINCAAYTNVDKAETDINSAVQLNIMGPKNLARVALEKNAVLIHISTDYVFDGQSKTPYAESENTNPITIYGKTKKGGEDEIIRCLDKYYIIRTAWLYGNNGKNFVNTMINMMNIKKEVTVVNDQTGSPTLTSNLASVIISIINKPDTPYGIYHYTDGGQTTWFEFACKINELGVKNGLINNNCVIKPCSSKEYKTPAKRPTYSVLSKQKIINNLGIEIKDWQNSLADFFLK